MCAQLPLPRAPEIDAFSTTPLRGTDKAWGEDRSAFTHSWHTTAPIWMNPPHHFLNEVAERLASVGGHAVVVTPSWAPANRPLKKLASARTVLPSCPSPYDAAVRWDTFVYYIRRDTGDMVKASDTHGAPSSHPSGEHRGSTDPLPSPSTEGQMSNRSSPQHPGTPSLKTRRKPREDYMLDPPVLKEVLENLQVSASPTRDAFADRATSQFPLFWDSGDDAFSKTWLGDHPLWMNPPFSLLPHVAAKLAREGGHAIVIAPSWSPANRELRALAQRRITLPAGRPLWRARGATLLPEPPWRTFAYLVNHLPHGATQPPLISLTRGAPNSPPRPQPTIGLDTPYVWREELPPPHSWDSWPREGVTAHRLQYGGRRFALFESALWDPLGPSPFLCPSCIQPHWPWHCSSLLPTIPPAPPHMPQVHPIFLIRDRLQALRTVGPGPLYKWGARGQTSSPAVTWNPIRDHSRLDEDACCPAATSSPIRGL